LDGLQTRAALPIDRGRGSGLGQPRVKPRVARDVQRLLAYLADAAADRILDLVGVDPGPLHQTLEHEAQHLDRVPGAELSAPLAEGRPNSAEDDCLVPAVASIAAAHRRAPPVSPGCGLARLGRRLIQPETI